MIAEWLFLMRIDKAPTPFQSILIAGVITRTNEVEPRCTDVHGRNCTRILGRNALLIGPPEQPLHLNAMTAAARSVPAISMTLAIASDRAEQMAQAAF